MGNVTMEARVRTIYGPTICYLPVLSAQPWAPKTAIPWWVDYIGTLPSVEGMAVCPQWTWYLARLDCELPSNSPHKASNKIIFFYTGVIVLSQLEMHRLGNQGLKVVVASSMISSKNSVFNFCFPKEAVYYSPPDSTDLESKCHLTIRGYPHH